MELSRDPYQPPPAAQPHSAVTHDWAETYRRTYPEIVRFLYRRVWDVERAQELAQEVFVRALSQTPENPRAWLFHVAANLARDEARRALGRRQALRQLQQEAPTPEAPEPLGRLEEERRQHALQRALEELSERDRDALLLWDAGLSYPEIAAELGLAVGAVGTTLTRARQRLVRAHTALEETHVAR